MYSIQNGILYNGKYFLQFTCRVPLTYSYLLQATARWALTRSVMSTICVWTITSIAVVPCLIRQPVTQVPDTYAVASLSVHSAANTMASTICALVRNEICSRMACVYCVYFDVAAYNPYCSGPPSLAFAMSANAFSRVNTYTLWTCDLGYITDGLSAPYIKLNYIKLMI